MVPFCISITAELLERCVTTARSVDPESKKLPVEDRKVRVGSLGAYLAEVLRARGLQTFNRDRDQGGGRERDAPLSYAYCALLTILAGIGIQTPVNVDLLPKLMIDHRWPSR